MLTFIVDGNLKIVNLIFSTIMFETLISIVLLYYLDISKCLFNDNIRRGVLVNGLVGERGSSAPMREIGE